MKNTILKILSFLFIGCFFLLIPSISSYAASIPPYWDGTLVASADNGTNFYRYHSDSSIFISQRDDGSFVYAECYFSDNTFYSGSAYITSSGTVRSNFKPIPSGSNIRDHSAYSGNLHFNYFSDFVNVVSLEDFFNISSDFDPSFMDSYDSDLPDISGSFSYATLYGKANFFNIELITFPSFDNSYSRFVLETNGVVDGNNISGSYEFNANFNLGFISRFITPSSIGISSFDGYLTSDDYIVWKVTPYTSDNRYGNSLIGTLVGSDIFSFEYDNGNIVSNIPNINVKVPIDSQTNQTTKVVPDKDIKITTPQQFNNLTNNVISTNTEVVYNYNYSTIQNIIVNNEGDLVYTDNSTSTSTVINTPPSDYGSPETDFNINISVSSNDPIGDLSNFASSFVSLFEAAANFLSLLGFPIWLVSLIFISFGIVVILILRKIILFFI